MVDIVFKLTPEQLKLINKPLIKRPLNKKR